MVYGRNRVARFATVRDDLDVTGTINLQIDQDVKMIPVTGRPHYDALTA